MSEIIKSLAESDYHGNKINKTPLFSYSTAKTIIKKSPYHAWLYHPLLGGESYPKSAAMNKGSIIHELLLGGGSEIVVIEADSFRTKEARDKKAEAEDAGKNPILAKDMDEINVSLDRIKEQIKLYAPYFFEPHESELSVMWELDNGVKCKSRFDWIQLGAGRMIDLKTTNDATTSKIGNKIIDFGYDIQEAFYRKCAEKTWPEMAGRFSWEFIFVETEPPYMVSVIETDEQFAWMGKHKYERASETWRECLESGEWPGYGKQKIAAPGWAVVKEGEEE